EAAVRAGCQAYFGYPITPQTEVLEYMARRMPEVGRVFLQAESEVAAVNMVYGAACAGARVMTSTSSPGFSLMQEGISYIAASQVPCVIVNVMRGGPGLGNIQPAQADYFQMTKGGGHGDYSPIVLAPSTVQEMVDLVTEAFDLADQYRQPVLIIADGMIGQIMEPVTLPEMKAPTRLARPWALTGVQGRGKNIITSLYLNVPEMEALNLHLQEVYAQIRAAERRWTTFMLEGAETVVVAYGTAGRICETAIRQARHEGLPVGLFRPISVAPFPYQELREACAGAKRVLVVEMSAGQMLEDVHLALLEQMPIEFYGKLGGVVPLPDEVFSEIRRLTA
ncbi:MAG: 3-methyl-2-oxobutanoate dehydrogenase subunit VorB, partial [Chloroflexi bacterium]|nr:3-methyl-2-oxobutanoate dehydrogenase subunit VorB [Chloroflexota bacterium]